MSVVSSIIKIIQFSQPSGKFMKKKTSTLCTKGCAPRVGDCGRMGNI